MRSPKGMISTRFLLLLLVLCFGTALHAQEKASLSGVLKDLHGHLLKDINVVVAEDRTIGTTTNDSGYYMLWVPAGKKITIEFRSLNTKTLNKVVKLKAGEAYTLTANLEEAEGIQLGDVDVKSTKTKEEASTVDIKPQDAIVNPNGSVESILKSSGLGVRSIGGELSSAYAVRGGSFDENLVYVNDFEIYRPYLVRSGQQEGLTFSNPDLISNIRFSSGGFQAKYGDKMSSVMDVTYKRPKRFAASAQASLLGGSVHLEGTSKDTSFTYLIGFRQKSSQYLIKSLETKGQYSPAFYDVQAYLTWKIKPKHGLEFIGNFAYNQFKFFPVDRQTDFGLVNRVVRLKMYFDGAENDKYQNLMAGLAYNYIPSQKLRLRFLGAAYHTTEREAFDIIGEYYLGEVETDLSKSNFDQVKYGLGTGATQNWARNLLTTTIYNIRHIGYYYQGHHSLQWGVGYKHEIIDDQLKEWSRLDSTGYTLPFNTEQINIQKYLNTKFHLQSNRYDAFFQDTWRFGEKNRITVTGGVRFAFWDVNKEFLASPRFQFSVKPALKRAITLSFSTGLYQQAPFYREMRGLDGTVNLNLKAQKSYHAVLGMDYDFFAWDRAFKFTTEAYYKYMWDLVPYELDNVLIRYFGKNNAVGYAYGLDLRLNGELAKGEESWISLSFLNARENLKDDYYKQYYDDSGRVTIPGSYGARPAVDSVSKFPGYVPRPTDQRVAFSMFFQDHIPKFPELKVHLGLDFATGLPFGPPDGRKDLDTLRLPAYKRVDIGFSGNLYNSEWKKHHIKNSVFKNLKTIWLTFEIFNVFGINNTVSYLWVKDFNNVSYAVPNYLSSRRYNARLIVKF